MLWHSDGFQVQEDLCNHIAKFSKTFQNLKNHLNFFQGNFFLFENVNGVAIRILKKTTFGNEVCKKHFFQGKYVKSKKKYFQKNECVFPRLNWNFAYAEPTKKFLKNEKTLKLKKTHRMYMYSKSWVDGNRPPTHGQVHAHHSHHVPCHFGTPTLQRLGLLRNRLVYWRFRHFF